MALRRPVREELKELASANYFALDEVEIADFEAMLPQMFVTLGRDADGTPLRRVNTIAHRRCIGAELRLADRRLRVVTRQLRSKAWLARLAPSASQNARTKTS
jgi:hypothetical protein